MNAIFRAVLTTDNELKRLLSRAPELCRLRASRDTFVAAVPHWLYVGDTSLHLAAAALRTGAAKILLDCGADPNAANRRGATPLHYACDPRPQSGGVWNPARQAELIDILVGHGGKVDQPDRGGATALHRAVRSRGVAAVRRLLDAGARTDRRLDRNGSLPLHLAVRPTGAGGTSDSLDAQLEIIAVLLEHGADPAAPDAIGRTPRDWATSEQIVSALGHRSSTPTVR